MVADQMDREFKESRERRKEMAEVIAYRDEKISQLRANLSNLQAQIAKLKSDLNARFEELATMQRHIARTSLSGRARRIVRPITRLFR